jgi:hypothetical protein
MCGERDTRDSAKPAHVCLWLCPDAGLSGSQGSEDQGR